MDQLLYLLLHKREADVVASSENHGVDVLHSAVHKLHTGCRKTLDILFDLNLSTDDAGSEVIADK